ncbi:uncharacterized protein Z518_10712 [Rhinocladiella mackenziei CBS 650.93]|uniref:CENP-T/Histone H4 histone fold domain-containing protein n=1 Tax=Rhinocladiella mackenziei CBS 650.93 TaxID=1442369 RepID=A0A0D2ISN6_9EURO|nr:uncharacterized protein Z518_10712 [Rhinocladiella mackenziei CBS 650.93]KIW99784.1 hypothetical protein Z518_10712 [Rhinocladiella mackenziei CBS 650.93]
MSSRKRPLSELHNSQTPARYAPSTPHAIRALQQRSSARARSVRKNRAFNDIVRPDSASRVLRRLAKITAPFTQKTIPTPSTARGKENHVGHTHGEEEVGNNKRPRLFLDIDGSPADMGLPDVGEEEDSELPVAPTPSILPEPGDDHNESERNNPTITFKSIDFARGVQAASEKIDRQSFRPSFPASEPLGDNEVEEDQTILSEIGRRAISEEPTGRLSRYSFGSIRMSDFGSELEIRRESDQQDQTKTLKGPNEYSGIGVDYESLDLDGVAENPQSLQRSPSVPLHDETTMNIPPLDESFRLEVMEEEAASNQTQGNHTGNIQPGPFFTEDQAVADLESATDAMPDGDESPKQDAVTEETLAAAAISSSASRRKKLKMTRHGLTVPSLPSSLIKRVAIEAQARLGNRRPKLGRDHMKALEQATEWFFEQVGEDLEAYSDHARRKKLVDSRDVLMLMQRQRVLQGEGDLQKCARELLPKEAADELDVDDA